MLVAIAVPFVIPLFIPILAVFVWVRRRYVTTSREVKRFEATTRSPVYASFSAAIKVRTLSSFTCSSGGSHVDNRSAGKRFEAATRPLTPPSLFQEPAFSFTRHPRWTLLLVGSCLKLIAVDLRSNLRQAVLHVRSRTGPCRLVQAGGLVCRDQPASGCHLGAHHPSFCGSFPAAVPQGQYGCMAQGSVSGLCLRSTQYIHME